MDRCASNPKNLQQKKWANIFLADNIGNIGLII